MYQCTIFLDLYQSHCLLIHEIFPIELKEWTFFKSSLGFMKLMVQGKFTTTYILKLRKVSLCLKGCQFKLKGFLMIFLANLIKVFQGPLVSSWLSQFVVCKLGQCTGNVVGRSNQSLICSLEYHITIIASNLT